MNKNVKGFVVVLIVAGIAFAAYKLSNKTEDLSSVDAMAEYLVHHKLAGSVSVLKTFDTGYLSAWVQAHKDGRKDFSYNDKTYRIQGGTAI